MKQTSGQIKNPLRKILAVLVLLVLLPAIFYLVFEMVSLNEYEQLITGIYEQQLDVILFSVNQYVWEYISSWQVQIDNLAGKTGPTAAQSLLQKNPALWYIMITDTLLENQRKYTLHDDKSVAEFGLDSLLSRDLIHRLQRYYSAGYKKIESIMIRGQDRAGDERMVLVSITNSGEVLFLLVDFSTFVEQVIVPKLEEIAGDKLAIGVFTQDSLHSVYQNRAFDVTKSQQLKKLWLFPDYLVGIRVEGKSLDDLAKDRLNSILAVIVVLLFVLIIGAWIVFRNIRNEIKLAQMKSDFVSNVSHELRTPLAVIRMYAEMLEMGRVANEDKRAEYYSIIHRESERLSRLINSILSFSRLESGKKVFDLQRQDLNKIVTDTLDIYGYHISNKGFTLKKEFADKLPVVNIDGEAVTECLINLLDNAIKYSDHRKEIQLVTGRNDKSVFVSVADQGIGIPQNEIGRIFDKFYRVSSGLIHNTKGSGLGLTLVRHIMDAHNGEVLVESKLDSGTVFTLFFPLRQN